MILSNLIDDFADCFDYFSSARDCGIFSKRLKALILKDLEGVKTRSRV